ncbi:MAG TPA: cytochrome ubiquinol oxidase subunit I [Candidatus Hydrogenedentes bacterium]|nr:cytochrome ubiquinol oxidase subunit I [Candidatus Hydrogenedentota bacterium]HOL75479.1 cytochrome ubiquinol oxidase subunit I [Candidatus Hydrogenedentota bacterium]HPO86079.1 cytochrome ubiquinol oxidase subunit I [Candidatus Hydrogenedentota bacterium]
MELDAITLSRLQFALTVMFHYIFPPLSIGLGWIMVIMEGAYLKTGDKEYEAIARFWTSIFAVVFAMGVASGIVMEFQFGTNWATYSRFVGDVFGSALAAEGIFAFFLESGFLAILVFGWDRVGPKMHFFSTVMVALGALFSSIWIVVANSWQQTPAGFHLVDTGSGVRAEITDFWAVVFNPSSVHRLVHVWIGCGILGAFFVLSISSYYLLKQRHVTMAKKMFQVALSVGLVMSLIAPISGHFQARNVAATQPAKLAAFEGHFHTSEGGAPLYLWGWPSEKERKVYFGLAIPGLLSFLVHESFVKPVPGLDQFPEEDWPPVWLSFQTYHVMLALGVYFIGITGLSAFLWWRGKLFDTRWLLWVLVFSVPAPFIANEFGWAAAELGRQPWIVYNLLRTADAASPAVSAQQVLGSIIVFGIIYAVLFALWLYILDKKIKRGPEVFLAKDSTEAQSSSLLDVASALTRHEGASLTATNGNGNDNNN